MNENFNKNAKVENLTKKLKRGVRLIIIGPFNCLYFGKPSPLIRELDGARHGVSSTYYIERHCRVNVLIRLEMDSIQYISSYDHSRILL